MNPLYNKFASQGNNTAIPADQQQFIQQQYGQLGIQNNNEFINRLNNVQQMVSQMRQNPQELAYSFLREGKVTQQEFDAALATAKQMAPMIPYMMNFLR